MRAWKHHISEDFEPVGKTPVFPGGPAAGATIFLDYDKMLLVLRKTGRNWHVAELDITEDDLGPFLCGTDFIVTINKPVWAITPFVAVEL